MDKNNDNKSTGLNGLNGEAKTEFLKLIWNSTIYQICLAKMVFDDSDAPVDYIILDINPAYEKAFGFVRDQAINKRVTELFPYYAHKWIEKYGEALRLGKNLISVEHIYEPYLLYEVQVFPLGLGDQFITMAQGITKHNEEKTRIENDITSNIIENEALIERVELLNALMDYNPSLIFLKDECGRYVFLNRTYEQQFVGSKNWYGKTDFDFWSKESAELFRANDLAVLETGRVTQHLEDSKDLNGTRYCWLNYKFPYTDSKNRRYSGGIGIDVTKRILAEEALRKAEEELQHYAEELKKKEEEALELIDGFTEGSWIVDRLAGTIKCSEKWSKHIGLDRVSEKERLRYTHTLIHLDDTVDGNSIEHCIKTGLTRFELEYRVKTVDSGYIWTQNRGKIVYNGQGEAVKVYAATIDITERKRIEEELRELEKRQAFLLKLSDAIRPLGDPITIQETASRLTGEHFGVTRVIYVEIDQDPDIVVVARDWARSGVPSVAGRYRMDDFGTFIAKLLRAGLPVIVEDVSSDPRIPTADHRNWELINTQAAISFPLIKDGRLVAYLALYHDHPHHWTEGEAELITEIAERTWASVERARAEETLIKAEQDKTEVLQKTIEMKDEFLSIISHEFKTPLTVINASVQAMRLICKDELSAKANTYLAKIVQNSNRQLKLVNNLLDITRINTGNTKLNPRNRDIILLTKAITESIKIFADQKGIWLSFTSTLGEKIIGIDEEKYERILLNLLSNAIKFTPRGKSIFVMVSQKVAKGKCKVCLQVKDQGIGIPQDKQQLIFEKFGQVDSSLSRQAEGTGIGLSLVKMVVELMGGEIAVESELGKGSMFTVLFPVTKIKETPIEKMLQEISDNRLIQATAIEFSDIY